MLNTQLHAQAFLVYFLYLQDALQSRSGVDLLHIGLLSQTWYSHLSI